MHAFEVARRQDLTSPASLLSNSAFSSFLLRKRHLLGFGLLVASASTVFGQGLQVTYGSKGVQTIAYNGTTLENTALFPADTFHIWHLKATDLAGNVLSSGQTGWGESNNGESWNSQTKTETYSFSWGSIATQFVQNGSNLDIVVTENNNTGSGIILDGAEIFPFALHFPVDPAGFHGYTQYAITTTAPGVSAADFGTGIVTAVLPKESQALYGGWKVQGTSTYSPILTSTAPDGLAAFLPHNDIPVQPGSSFTYTASLRFTPEGTPAMVTDAYASFAATYPSQMTWTDKRILGTAYLASSPTGGGDITQPGGFPTNPRRYFNDASVDITSAAGLQAFQTRMLAQAASNVSNAKNLNAQGVITWDLEGEQYPQTTSYVCSPDQIATIAPEMDSTITDHTSPFYGQKLDDAYFKTMTNAGLRVGLCIRPQRFTLGPNGTASQVTLTGNAAIIANLETKARVANSRWGVTVFYVDSNVDAYGGTLDPAIYQQLITDLPQMLFVPEESTPRYYAYSAPFYTFIFHGDLGTPASILSLYPHAFGANLINDVAPSTLAAATPQLTQSVAQGDILMGHADYWQSNDPALVSIYKAAGVAAPVAPAQATLTLAWPTPSPIAYGTALSAAQLDATANLGGTFTYSPAAGTVLRAGTSPLTATFTPVDTTHYSPASLTRSLTITAATPTLNWSSPAPIVAGTALSSTQLNATASIPGTFAYTPSVGTILNAGTNTLSAVFTPSDLADYSSASVSVPLVVNAAATSKVAILSPAAGVTVSGTLNVVGQVNVPLDSAGSYLMVDGVEVGTQRLTSGPFTYPLNTTTLSNGYHVLQIWAHDVGNNTTVSAPITVYVSNMQKL